MSKFLKYPNGFVGVVSDEVAAILATRPGHQIVNARPPRVGTTNFPLMEKAGRPDPANEGAENA